MTFAPEVVARIGRDGRVPVLETARLKLRAPRREDAKAVAVLANEFLVAANTARLPHPYRIADAELFIAHASKRDGGPSFIIVLDGSPIGACGIDLRTDGAELGYWLGMPFWGQGFATEAARAVIDYAFGELDLEALHAGARVSNPASRRVLEKCAFQWIGVRLTRIRAINSAAPVDRFRLDRGLWASLKAWGRVTHRGLSGEPANESATNLRKGTWPTLMLGASL